MLTFSRSGGGCMAMRLIVAALLSALAVTGPSEARGFGHGGGHGSGRVYYGGGHHTSSHGGSYRGAIGGSSHRSGHYTNPRTSNRYGRHR